MELAEDKVDVNEAAAHEEWQAEENRLRPETPPAAPDGAGSEGGGGGGGSGGAAAAAAAPPTLSAVTAAALAAGGAVAQIAATWRLPPASLPTTYSTVQAGRLRRLQIMAAFGLEIPDRAVRQVLLLRGADPLPPTQASALRELVKERQLA